MNSRKTACAAVVFSSLLPLLLGCDDPKPAVEVKAASAASATPAAIPAPSAAPTPSAATAPTSEKAERPSKVETELTDARRAAVEAKYPAAKGFLIGSELEAKLKANKALKDKKGALAAFDKAASGRWVLFSGPAVNLTDDGFDVGIVYTPQLPNDPMGMSRQFFEVTLTKVEGYSKDTLKTGNVVVVLAKYNGGGKASPAQELVATGAWK